MENDVIFSNDEFYISYVKEPSEFANALDYLCHAIGGRPAPTGQDETAICIRDGSKLMGTRYLILYGDHREAYRVLVPNLNKCISYFNTHLDQIGHSSDTLQGLNS